MWLSTTYHGKEFKGRTGHRPGLIIEVLKAFLIWIEAGNCISI